jgi:hypothetical protein
MLVLGPLAPSPLCKRYSWRRYRFFLIACILHLNLFLL